MQAGAVAYIAILNAMVATQNANLFTAVVLIGAIAVPMAVLLLAHSGGVLGHQEPPSSGLLTVGFIEEAATLIVPLVVFIVARRRTPGMGVVLGSASGMGFTVLETMGTGSPPCAVVSITILAVLIVASHRRVDAAGGNRGRRLPTH